MRIKEWLRHLVHYVDTHGELDRAYVLTILDKTLESLDQVCEECVRSDELCE